MPRRVEESWRITKLETSHKGWVAITKHECDGEAFGFDFAIREGAPGNSGPLLLSFRVERVGPPVRDSVESIADSLAAIGGVLETYVNECRPALRAAAEQRQYSEDPPSCACFSCQARKALAGLAMRDEVEP